MSIRRQFDVFTVFLIALLGLSLFHLGRGDAREQEPRETPTHGDVQRFHAGVADFFQVPLSQVEDSAAAVEVAELPVVFFLARYGAAEPQQIVALRENGEAWQEVATQLGLGADSFYFPLAATGDPALGRAFERFHNRPRSQWPEIRLSDQEIVSLVNLRFLSEQSGERPVAVIDLRAQGSDFIAIYEHLQQRSPPARAPNAPAGAMPG